MCICKILQRNLLWKFLPTTYRFIEHQTEAVPVKILLSFTSSVVSLKIYWKIYVLILAYHITVYYEINMK